MKSEKRMIVKESDAVSLLREVMNVVPPPVYDVIVDALHLFDSETDKSKFKQLSYLEKILIDNLGPYPELFSRFKDFFPEEYQSTLKKAKIEPSVSPCKVMIQSGTTSDQFQTLNNTLLAHQQCTFEKTLDFVTNIRKDVKDMKIFERFQKWVELYNTRTIDLTTLLEKNKLLFIGNEHLLPQLAEFIITDLQDLESEQILSTFKEQYRQFDYTKDSEKLVNYHLKYLRRLKAKVNHIDAYNRAKALLVLFKLEIINFDQLKTMLSISMTNEPPEAMSVLNELFDSLNSVHKDNRIDKTRLLKELEDLESSRRDYYMKPAHLLNTERMEPCTTSYVFLPLDYPILKASSRTKLHDSVLNDRVISVSFKTESSDMEHGCLGHNDHLYAIEDELHNASRTLNLLIATLNAVEAEARTVTSLSAQDTNATMESTMRLKTIHLSCIRTVFNSDAEILMDSFQSNSKQNFGVMINALKLKISEWKQNVRNLESIWKDCPQENPVKVSDGSTQFFQSMEQDSLSHQCLFKEISQAADHPAKSTALKRIQIIDFETCRTNSDLTHDFSARDVKELCFSSVETRTKSQTPRHNSIFLKRNILITYGQNLTRNSNRLMPKFLLLERLRYNVESDKIIYTYGREDWMISLRRKTSDVFLIEAKSIAMSNWLRKSVSKMTPVHQNKS